MTQANTLERLEAGMPVISATGQVIRVSAELAARFQPGDSLAVVAHSGELLRIPAAEKQIATAAVTRGVNAFQAMGAVTDAQISAFYEHFAGALEDDQLWSQIAEVNAQDVVDARARGRSTTRLVATEKLRKGMAPPVTLTPPDTLPRSTVPVTSVPMKLPATTLPPELPLMVRPV